MADPTRTVFNLGGVVKEARGYEPGLLTFPDLSTMLEGTILARDSVSLLFVPFVIGGSTNENGIPKAVLTVETTSTAAEDVPVRPLIDGDVYVGRLVVDADGDASNVTAAHLDALRSYGIVSYAFQELNQQDNPQP